MAYSLIVVLFIGSTPVLYEQPKSTKEQCLLEAKQVKRTFRQLKFVFPNLFVQSAYCMEIK
jgi:hypothetical protein